MHKTVYRVPFKLLGIPVQLDLTLLLVLPLLAWLIGSDLDKFIAAFNLELDPGPLTEGFTPYLLGFFAALGLFLSILIHELAHSFVGQRFDLKIKSITLWVLGGMAEFERIPQQRGTEAVMAVAGPITSFLLAGLTWILQMVVPPTEGGLRFLLAYLFYMNTLLAGFNLIPALPLDGGRVLRSLLAMRISYLKATQVAAALSKILAVALGLLGFLSLNIWLMLIAFFIFIAVSGESSYVSVAEVLKRIHVDDLMTEQVATVEPEMSVDQLIKRMFEQHHLGFPVVDSSDRVVGFVSLPDVRRLKASGLDENTATVEMIMSREIAAIDVNASALEAFQLINQGEAGRLVVLDSTGKLRGIISKTDLIRAVQIANLEDQLHHEQTA